MPTVNEVRRGKSISKAKLKRYQRTRKTSEMERTFQESAWKPLENIDKPSKKLFIANYYKNNLISDVFL